MFKLGMPSWNKTRDLDCSVQMTVNGEALKTSKGFEVINPADGSVVGVAPSAGQEDVNAAVLAAEKAQKLWARTDDDAKREACRKMAGALKENLASIAELITLEQGKPLKGKGAEFEVMAAAMWFDAAAKMSLDPKVIKEDETVRVEQVREPIGVIGSITPWNWPVMIAAWHIAPAIRSGNAVVIKPSPNTPLSTLLMVEVLNKVLPKGLLNCVSGGNEVGASMSSHPRIGKIVFTGSTATGKKIMESGASNLKRLTLELGGNDAGVVLPDVDPKSVAPKIFATAFANSGQTCAALKRLYVHESQYEDMCAALVDVANATPMGAGMDEGSVIGPLQNKAQLDIVSSLVDDARANGARILTGGAPTGTGFFYPVTLVADAKAGMRLVDEEQFGTALPIIAYSDLDDAIEQANSLDFGLMASVWSSNLEKAHEVASHLEAGTVNINTHGGANPFVPMGGIKGSGVGVEFGVEGLEANTNIKIYNIVKA